MEFALLMATGRAGSNTGCGHEALRAGTIGAVLGESA